MKPKRNVGSKFGSYDNCFTLPYALDPLMPYIHGKVVWESACGAGFLLRDFAGEKIETDIIYGFDFFQNTPDRHWDIQVTNPPYSLKYKWLARSYELGKPFCLLVPLEMLGAQATQKFWSIYGLPFVIVLSRRVNFIMPEKGLEGNGAQFPVMWYCHGIGKPGQFEVGIINYEKVKQQELAYKSAVAGHV